MLIHRRTRDPRAHATDPLLTELLDAPTGEARLRPVTLRSVADQRRAVLAPYPLRTWFDRWLAIGERVLASVVIAVFGWWLIDGYGRDWWHARAEQQRMLAEAVAQPTVPAHLDPTVASVAYPELGASLPVVEDRTDRPSVSRDYLVPAQMYVAPLLPTPPDVTAVPAPVDLRPTHVSIPALSLDSDVVEVFIQDGAWQVADYAVGYHHGTGGVGHGNTVMAGHKGIRGSVFARLENLKAGDDVFVDAHGQRFHYRVRTTQRVWPNQVDVMFPTDQPQLTLLTCTNWDTQRFVVVADFIGAVSDSTAAGGK